MRLDHLLSTEFSGRLSGVRRVPPSSMMVVDVVGVAGVEEIMGFGCPCGCPGSGAGMLLGSRTATAPVVVWRGPARRRGPVGFSRGACSARAWWFENWIVDASNRKTVLFSVALSRFRQTPFGVWFEIDRFVIIL